MILSQATHEGFTMGKHGRWMPLVDRQQSADARREEAKRRPSTAPPGETYHGDALDLFVVGWALPHVDSSEFNLEAMSWDQCYDLEANPVRSVTLAPHKDSHSG